ncbi:unnamed protein product [Brugia timori]|uniref:Ricin B-type lectin domain-containing protein n=1 Tax=Brugia timori TaxID=42155 RepID=A0A0R3QTN6_9BILA|nr:unnamed protein product [Brugia timori]
MWSFLLISFCIQEISSFENELFPRDCDCRDWNGGCRRNGEKWLDDDTWVYRCNGKDGYQSEFLGCQSSDRSGKVLIQAGDNKTIDGFWFSCSHNTFRLKYEEEPRCVVNNTQYHTGDLFRENYFQWLCLENGRWITGCYYQNETKHWILLKIGQTGYSDLVKHVCDQYDDYPGRVQYYAEVIFSVMVRKDVSVKHPSNKGKNTNLPQLVDNRLKDAPVRWLHTNAANFIISNEGFKSKIRYLPDSKQM